ncbi:hypothetical protein [Hydrogenophaga atypica]|uniref:Uncharacterized protein n=1 Tax=Hydrogenophaga atypica TaxID=249409 RepID=A0ABW2QLN9_9BURK
MNDDQERERQEQQDQERRREQDELERSEMAQQAMGAGSPAMREAAGSSAAHRPAFGQAPVVASVGAMGQDTKPGQQSEQKGVLPRGRSMLGIGLLAVAITGVAMGAVWWKKSRQPLPTLIGQTETAALPDVLDSVKAVNTTPPSAPALPPSEDTHAMGVPSSSDGEAPAPVAIAPVERAAVTATPMDTVASPAGNNPLQVDEGEPKPPSASSAVAPQVQPEAGANSDLVRQDQEQRIARLEQQVAQLMESAKPRQVAPRPVSSAGRTAQGRSSAAGSAKADATRKSAQKTQGSADASHGVALLSVDLWDGKPSVVVGTTDPANPQVRVLKPGDSLSGVTLKQVDMSGQKATFEVGGRIIELSRAN